MYNRQINRVSFGKENVFNLETPAFHPAIIFIFSLHLLHLVIRMIFCITFTEQTSGCQHCGNDRLHCAAVLLCS